MKEPLRVRPHHAERAQRFIRYKKASDEEFLKTLKDAVKDDPDAEMIFVKDYDLFCKQCTEGGAVPHCMQDLGANDFITDVISEMDEVVAKEHGWEFNKPYKVKDLLSELDDEALERNIFYISQLTHDEYSRWLEDVRRGKGV